MRRCLVIFFGVVVLGMMHSSLKAERVPAFSLSISSGVMSHEDGVKITQFQFLSGMGIDFWLMQKIPTVIASLGLSGELPSAYGNSSVSIKPYLLYSDMRLMIGSGFSGHFFAIMPFFELRGQLGTKIIATQVQNKNWLNADILYGFGPGFGLSCTFASYGFTLGYASLWGSNNLRHRLAASLFINFDK